jgi:hypothetical protein
MSYSRYGSSTQDVPAPYRSSSPYELSSCDDYLRIRERMRLEIILNPTIREDDPRGSFRRSPTTYDRTTSSMDPLNASARSRSSTRREFPVYDRDYEEREPRSSPTMLDRDRDLRAFEPRSSTGRLSLDRARRSALEDGGRTARGDALPSATAYPQPQLSRVQGPEQQRYKCTFCDISFSTGAQQR